MKEAVVQSNLRLVQVFLSTSTKPGPSIYEVSVDDSGKLHCICPNFVSTSSCKHYDFVNTKIKENNGSYPLEILSKATEEEAAKAKSSDSEYRSFIIKYGKIEVF